MVLLPFLSSITAATLMAALSIDLYPVHRQILPSTAAMADDDAGSAFVESAPAFWRQKPCQRHYNSGCAKPALGGTFITHNLLHQAQPAHPGSFNGYQVFPMDVCERHQATGDASVLQFSPDDFSYQNRACPAIAFAATDLCARELLVVADEVYHHHPWRCLCMDQLFIENEAYHISLEVKTNAQNESHSRMRE
jgi:hypothetical protein